MGHSRSCIRGGQRLRHLGSATVLAAVSAAAFAVVPAAASSPQAGGLGRDDGGRNRVATWGASPVVGATSPFPGLVCQAGTGVSGQTVRDVLFTSAGGSQVQVRLTNSFGT